MNSTQAVIAERENAERVAFVADECFPGAAMTIRALLARAEAAEAEVARLREGVLAILDGGAGFVVAEPWARDGSWSKNDRCAHGRWWYENCPSCLDAAIRAALATATESSAPTRDTERQADHG